MNKAVIQGVGEFLASREICFDMLDDGEALVFGINGQNGIWRTVVTTNEDGRVVTFHSLLPARVPVGRRSRCAELLARLNHGNRLGMFQIDTKKGLIEFCVSSLLPEAEARPDMVDILLGVSLTTMDEHFARLMACVYGSPESRDARSNTEGKHQADAESRLDLWRN